MKYIFIVALAALIAACDPPSVFVGCTYYYPLKTVNLKDTITTKDTVWFINEIDPHVCLEDGKEYQNGGGVLNPYIKKLENDSFLYYKPIPVGVDTVLYGTKYNNYLSDIKYSASEKLYKSQFGFIFKEPGTYCVYNFNSELINHINSSIALIGYFNVKDNNQYLINKKVNLQYIQMGEPLKYANYFFVVK